MSRDPVCDCGIWPCDQPNYPPPRDTSPHPPGADWRPRYRKGSALLHRRSCRDCGKPVRVADIGFGIRLRTEPEPVPASDVRPHYPAWWWTDRWGLVDRVAGHDRDEPLFILHPCDHPPRPPQPQPAQGEPRMTAPTFGTARPPGEGATNADLQGKLLLIKVTEKKTGFVTSSGLADVVVADVVDLAGGEEHPDNFLFGKVLFGQFEVGVTYLGTIGKGIAKPGQYAPWLFTGSEGDPAAVAQATQYLAYKASAVSAPAAALPAAAPWAA